MSRQKTADPALPYFTRLYKRHKKMVKDISKARKVKEAEAVRLSIEEAHDRYVLK